MTLLIEASYRLTTPLFCSGADPAIAELRMPSFKGVLRFWWRALAWSRCAGDLAVIQQQEDELFGSTRTGRARVVMRLMQHTRLDMKPKGSTLYTVQGDSRPVGMGARYLGYGLMTTFGAQAGRLKRGALLAPLDFSVQLRAAHLDVDLQTSLLQSLIALGTLGGMGSRSRKGYGSLALCALTVDGESVWESPRCPEALQKTIHSLLLQVDREGLPNYTAVSKGARVVVLAAEDCKEPLNLLDLVGREMVRYRSWGHNGKVLDNITREEIFKTDHDLMICTSPRVRRSHPKRIAFGLPHNYKQGKGYEVSAYEFDRRASPLFIHIHQCGSGPVAVASFLPARFLPVSSSGDSAMISVGGQKIPQISEHELYQTIHTFLDRLLDRIPTPHHRKEIFDTALEVKP